MRTALIAFLSLAWIGGAVLAETKAPALAPLSLAPAAAGTLAGTAVASMKRERNGKAGRKRVAQKGTDGARSPSSASDALTSCLAMWEPATHMTKREWSRACRRVAERLKDTTIK